MTEKSSGVRILSELALEMRDTIARLAGPRHWHDSRESWLAKGARNAGITYRSAKALFYGEAINPRALTIEKVRRAAKELDETDREIGNSLREERRSIIDRISRIETALRISDEEFNSPQADQLREIIRSVVRIDRPVDEVDGERP